MAELSSPSLKSLSGWPFEDFSAGLGPHERVTVVVPASDKGVNLGFSPLTQAASAWCRTWRSMVSNRTSTRFSHDAEVKRRSLTSLFPSSCRNTSGRHHELP